ncbi:MAG: NAD-dependent epimerase/dehydratase family protein [Actinomycetota bacterium]|nr:NAD-dependent epimerase/dehydratase family protein [Actinomycetota bacterium]
MATILILGGTAWLGRELARQAAEAGHAVTCLARGTAAATPGVELVKADREKPGAYAGVVGRSWDVVVDVSRQPGQVREAVAALASYMGSAGQWVFVSTGSVYSGGAEHHFGNEGDPTKEPLTEDVADPEHYGEGKVACEWAVLDVLGADRVTIARVGLIAGPGDGSDRFGYWPAAFGRAVADGGPVMVPDVTDQSVQLIDVRDLAGWLLHAGVNHCAGTFDVVGAASTVGELLDAAKEAAGFTGETVAVEPDWLIDQQVAYWAGPRSLPLWLPAGHELLVRRTAAKAVAAGLDRRAYAELAADVLADERDRGVDRERQAGLTRAEELELINAWRAESVLH